VPFVLDASVAMAWCFEDETSLATEAALDRLADDPAVVPSLWEFEVGNVLLVAERRGRLNEFEAARFLELLERLPINIDLAPIDIGALVAAGRRHELSAYDAAYLVLAERDGIPLATQDETLRSAARRAGVPLIGDDSVI
jgi:predicted nucleic acid-binding protein